MGLDGRSGIDQPLVVLAGQSGEPAGFGAPDGCQRVALAASAVGAARMVPAGTVRICGESEVGLPRLHLSRLAFGPMAADASGYQVPARETGVFRRWRVRVNL